ncbi:MAG: hypothetical protein ISN26_03845 [Betaproteobacteria bacterium AqS2]|uniref:Lipoprotein n=1 Tax=Candidatus Amphirhobacter heronislandensis TaxID=1732024 RepID=A0A930UF12_9GAMM|nr:hypothetical protein [Betaproteobacteria bacterium AqS2]
MKKPLLILAVLILAGCSLPQRPGTLSCAFKGQAAELRAFLEQRGDVMVVVERLVCR